ncbi:MAG: phosphate ABC transporter substrate-binding protein PstS [Acidobacteriia bacterium]|nr:phosphate ABC transporter substrate-binding protein PstS [Terriglobia bacterium]
MRGQLDSHSEAFLTVRISKRAGLVGLVLLTLLCTLIVLDLREKDGRQSVNDAEGQKPAAASVSIEKEVGITNPKVPVREPNSGHAAGLQTPQNRVDNASVATAEIENRRVAGDEDQAPLAPTLINNVELAVIRTGPATIQGAGATFPYLIYSEWFSAYHRRQPEVQFNYQPLGSGGGIRQVLAGTVDFGASDVPMTDEQLSQATTRILHVPTVLGAVVPIYNVRSAGELKFTPEVLAGIYLGKIVSWNDAAIARANPTLNLPNQPIIVVHRSDGCATTFVFTDYLSKISGEWRDSSGKGTSVRWPVGLGGKGNEGVAGIVQPTEGAIGYVDLLYAEQSGVSYGSVRNQAGKFVKANLDNLTEAAASVGGEIPADFRVSITNAPGSDAYPIASFTWLLVPQRAKDPATGGDLAAFLNWMITDGQTMTKQLGYAPLPRSVVATVSRSLSQVH